MMRRILVVGDAPVPGGAVLPYGGPESTIHGHRVALIGGRAYCEGCNSVGIIAKAGGQGRTRFYDAEVALEGDVVICHCPVPPPLMSTLQTTSYHNDLRGGLGTFDPSFSELPGWFAGDSAAVAASSKIVDDLVEHPPEAEQTENICPNMTNKEFCTLVLDLRADAVKMVEGRLKELDLWGKPEKARVKQWFGTDDETTRRRDSICGADFPGV
ncbi:PAAR domain-containing protein [Variovorax ginsengisoli]|uniref:Zn-binding protein involved in type VI secretion n=1 Tax=Variovorax ginsengisoli TaxID=363844 RepID=A0ABT9S156_9BURK|nr:PAAR domain-containing protein [Variovorax ginsengisoli]MDP9898071.1 putative Zn-binding protein involved in type VI secretion [Variovorax ginsengisoli]